MKDRTVLILGPNLMMPQDVDRLDLPAKLMGLMELLAATSPITGLIFRNIPSRTTLDLGFVRRGEDRELYEDIIKLVNAVRAAIVGPDAPYEALPTIAAQISVLTSLRQPKPLTFNEAKATAHEAILAALVTEVTNYLRLP